VISPVQIPSQHIRKDLKWYFDGDSEALNDILRRQELPPGIKLPGRIVK